MDNLQHLSLRLRAYLQIFTSFRESLPNETDSDDDYRLPADINRVHDFVCNYIEGQGAPKYQNEPLYAVLPQLELYLDLRLERRKRASELVNELNARYRLPVYDILLKFAEEYGKKMLLMAEYMEGRKKAPSEEERWAEFDDRVNLVRDRLGRVATYLVTRWEMSKFADIFNEDEVNMIKIIVHDIEEVRRQTGFTDVSLRPKTWDGKDYVILRQDFECFVEEVEALYSGKSPENAMAWLNEVRKNWNSYPGSDKPYNDLADAYGDFFDDITVTYEEWNNNPALAEDWEKILVILDKNGLRRYREIESFDQILPVLREG